MSVALGKVAAAIYSDTAPLDTSFLWGKQIDPVGSPNLVTFLYHDGTNWLPLRGSDHFMDPVISQLATPPPSPNNGDRYLVAASGLTGDFIGHPNAVATWNNNTTMWEFTTAKAGNFLYNATIKVNLLFNGTEWLTQNRITGDHIDIEGGGGAKIKVVSGDFEFKNIADSGWVNIKAESITLNGTEPWWKTAGTTAISSTAIVDVNTSFVVVEMLSRAIFSGIYLQAETTGNIYVGLEDSVTSSFTGFTFTEDGNDSIASFTDSRTTKTGLEYAADYSGDFTVRSLIDKGFADGAYILNGATTTLTADTKVVSVLNTLEFTSNTGVGLRPIISIEESAATHTTFFGIVNGFASDSESYIRVIQNIASDTAVSEWITNAYGTNQSSTDLIIKDGSQDTHARVFLFVTPSGESGVTIGGPDSVSSIDSKVQISALGVKLSFDDSVGILKTATLTDDGIIYGGDYNTDFVARSLIDKGFADSTYITIAGAWVSDLTTGAASAVQNTVTTDISGQTGTQTFTGLNWDITKGARSSTGAIEFLNFKIGGTSLFHVENVDGTTHVEVGDHGTEGTGININGTTYDTALRVNDYGAINKAQFIVHRHSTTLAPVILGARTNSNTTSHTAVVAGQSTMSLLGAGYTGSHYDLFASIDFEVDTGTVSATSSPGRIVFKTTADGSNSPTEVMSLYGNKNVIIPNGNLTIGGDGLIVPVGLDAARVETQGSFRLNTTGTINAEIYDGTSWLDLSGGASSAGSNNYIQTSDGSGGFKAAEGGTDTPVIGLEDAATNTVLTGLQLNRLTTSTAAVGLGLALKIGLEENGGTIKDALEIRTSWSTLGTDDSSELLIKGYSNNAIINFLKIAGFASTNITSIALGGGAVAANNINSPIAIGSLAEAQNAGSISMGRSAGTSTGTTNSNYISIGVLSNSLSSDIGLHAIGMGYQVSSIGSRSIAIQESAEARNTGSIAIGRETISDADGAVMMGYHTTNLTNSRADSFAVGWGESIPSMWIEKGIVATTDATANTTLKTIALDTSSTYHVSVKIVGGETDGTPTEFAGYTLEGVFYRIGSGSATQEGATTVITSIESTGTMDANLSVSGNDVLVRITGVASTSMNWRTLVTLTKVVSN